MARVTTSAVILSKYSLLDRAVLFFAVVVRPHLLPAQRQQHGDRNDIYAACQLLYHGKLSCNVFMSVERTREFALTSFINPALPLGLEDDQGDGNNITLALEHTERRTAKEVLYLLQVSWAQGSHGIGVGAAEVNTREGISAAPSLR
jgi:hypothetical protein